MLRTRGTRNAIAALAMAATAALAVPGTATADEPPAGDPNSPINVTFQALLPAIIGAAAGPTDIAENPNKELLEQARTLLAQSNLPDSVKSTLSSVIAFLDGSGGGGPALPPTDGPVIQQFLFPTLGQDCVGPNADSVGTALAVAGPAQLPPPGPAAGQTGFVFTALGTAPAVDQQPADVLTVHWVNLDNRTSGNKPLTNGSKINPDGPSTLSAIADTGSGRVVAAVYGSLTSKKADADPTTCNFLPTIGVLNVP